MPIFFSRAHGIFTKIDYMLGCKTCFNKFRGLKSYSEHPCYSGIKWEIKKKKIPGKSPSIWKLNNILVNKLKVKEEFKREMGKYLELNENKNIVCQNLWDAAKAVL